jgi:hypothetical protein
VDGGGLETARDEMELVVRTSSKVSLSGDRPKKTLKFFTALM